MTRLGRSALLPAILAAAVIAGCGQPAPAVSAAPAATLAAAAPATEPTAPTAEQAAPAPAATRAAAATSWAMPDLVGKNLQAAQDAIQALTGDAVFVTTSHDATGAGRRQVLDRNWKVCSQNIKPGIRITADTRIDFAAAKLTEHC